MKTILSAALAFVFACAAPASPGGLGSGEDEDETKSGSTKGKADDHDEADTGKAGVYPAVVFTGYDGTHAYKVPVSLVGGGSATWTADDPSLVTLETKKEGVMITAKKAGATTVTAKVGSKSYKVKVTITKYAESAWAAGEKVYTTSLKCNGCHVKASGPDHSPSEIGKHEDAHIRARITTGESLHGEATQANHKFGDRLDDAGVASAIAYIRALKPKAWPSEEHGHED